MAAKKKTKKKTKKKVQKLAPRISKSTYILQYPKLSAGELVEQGKKDGFEFSDKYVYTIRSNAKRKGRSGKKVVAKETGTTKKARVNFAKTAESAFVEVAVQIGLERAEGLLKLIKEAAHGV